MAIEECISNTDPRRELAGAQAQAFALLEVFRRCDADSDLEVLAEGVLCRLLASVDALESWLRHQHQVSLVPGIDHAGGGPACGEVPAESMHGKEVANA